ncbi:LSU ribosomal protein L10P [Caldanaerobius fijiensis DSM 17918]|uniref:Large ribosomal subunit protein uL10 n=1 Tax=Caldanaerobius fijiensis DSM 17918 TaxID=1121256 RepID=A0A1M5EU95_9THEO|nr:50S ribosomal protein L10 [Caldanaerobius fijiensis]SHF82651.1 LSU ribosomal protein L10P [Caldanaerobius fijiensis DSM 17918]
MLNKAEKAQIVQELKEKLSTAQAAILVDYKGINVEEDTKLRRELRQSGVEYKVVKNTLLSIAAKELGYEGLLPYLEGPTALALGVKDPVAPAKVLYNYAKDHENFKFKVGILQGNIIGVDEIINLAKLPPKEELIAKVLGSMNAPIANFVGVLSATLRNFVYVLNAIKEKKAA